MPCNLFHGPCFYRASSLLRQLEGVTALLTNLTLGRTWMLQMGFGAEAAGVFFQLCMAYPRHALQSVEMPTVTQVSPASSHAAFELTPARRSDSSCLPLQIRVSDDHMPGVNDKHQWSIGYSCLLAWALGLAVSRLACRGVASAIWQEVHDSCVVLSSI